VLQHICKDHTVEAATFSVQSRETLRRVATEHSVEMARSDIGGGFVDLDALDPEVWTARLQQRTHRATATANVQ
jgi:hypothetical protein